MSAVGNIGYILLGCILVHALVSGKKGMLQRLILVVSLFIFGYLLEYRGVMGGHYYYPLEGDLHIGVVPLPVTCSWVALIYSGMKIAEKMGGSVVVYILATTTIVLSLDWGMDPIATFGGAWFWNFEGGSYFGIPSFNFIQWFFIPAEFLIPYGLVWNKDAKKVQILTVSAVDQQSTWYRKLYSLFIVPLLAFGLLLFTELFATLPFIYNLPQWVMYTLAILTIGAAIGLIIWKRKNLLREKWADILPPLVLSYIAFNWALISFLLARPDFGYLVILTCIPIWLVLVLSIFKKK